ncbi:MAG: trigger factor [Chloroflexi bacterium]|nr:trigger factor [Chloroflexota bacterium]
MLNLKEEKIGPALITLEVEVEPERVDKAMHQAAQRIASAGRIDGFRKGRAPYQLVLRTYGKDTVLQEAVDKLGNEVLQEALTERDITPYDNPSLEVLSQEPLTLKFIVPTKPIVDLGNYRSLRADPTAPEVVDDSKVNDSLEQVRKANATRVPVERPAQMGDVLRADLKVDLPERNLFDRKDAELELVEGDEDLVPGFSAAMVGAGIAETRDLELAMPTDFENEELAGKTLHVNATVHDIKEVQLPALDDELAKTVGTFDTLDEMRADIRKNLQENAARRARDAYEHEVLKTAVANARIEFPDAMVEEELRHSLADLQRDVERQGFTVENWLRINNLSVEGLRAAMRPGIEERLRNTLFLYNLAEREGIRIEASDIDSAVEEEAAQYPEDMQPRVRQAYANENARTSLALRLVQRRALERLLSIARGEGVLLPGDETSRPSEILVAHA